MGPKVSVKATKVVESTSVASSSDDKKKTVKNVTPKVEVIEEEVEVESEELNEVEGGNQEDDKIVNESGNYGIVLNELEEWHRMLIQIAQQQIKGVRSLKKDIVSQTKKLFKYEQKKATQKKTNQNKGPQKLIPIYTKEMEQFFKDFHMLKDKNDHVIYEKIESDSEHVLGSREIALKLITAYIKSESLQDTVDKKRINMDARLKELLPKLVGAKDGEDNCYFHTLMGAIAEHFKA
jgi:hypothetical protein